MSFDKSEITLGFIGAGVMASAIFEQLIKGNVYKSSQIIVSYPSANVTKKYSHLNLGAETVDNEYIVKNCNVLFLCVKPQILDSVLKSIVPFIDTQRQLIVSIITGIQISVLEKYFQNDNVRLVRWAINTAASIGQSANTFR
jgi:pyrroline-5-carboxylate reductase